MYGQANLIPKYRVLIQTHSSSGERKGNRDTRAQTFFEWWTHAQTDGQQWK